MAPGLVWRRPAAPQSSTSRRPAMLERRGHQRQVREQLIQAAASPTIPLVSGPFNASGQPEGRGFAGSVRQRTQRRVALGLTDMTGPVAEARGAGRTRAIHRVDDFKEFTSRNARPAPRRGPNPRLLQGQPVVEAASTRLARGGRLLDALPCAPPAQPLAQRAFRARARPRRSRHGTYDYGRRCADSSSRRAADP